MVISIKSILVRDLQTLIKEMNLFPEENLWRTAGSVKNSAGNLCLHLVGNLNTYIGKNLGNTGYVRNREAEFSMKNISREELVNKVDQTIKMIGQVLNSMNDDNLQNEYPEDVLGYKMTTGYFLVHLCAHLSYHLGQVNYLRRIMHD